MKITKIALLLSLVLTMTIVLGSCDSLLGLDSIQEQIDALEEKNNDLQAEIDALKKENEDLKADIESLNKENDDLKEDIGDLNKENGNLKDDIDNLNKESSGLKGDIDNLNKENEELKAEIDELKNNNSQSSDIYAEALDFHPLPDGTYGVMAGNTLYMNKIVIPAEYNGKPVTQILPYAFQSATNLTDIVIPDSVTSIGSQAFYNCSSLTSVVIPDSVTSIGSGAFVVCHSLYVVYNNSDLLLEIGSTNNGLVAFYARILVNNRKTIYADDGYNYTLTDDGFLFREKDSKYELISYIGGEDTVTLPEDINGNPYDLYYMSGVVNVIIPEGFTTINDYAFYGCCSLTSVVIPDSVTSIGSSAFWGCTNLASVVIPDSITFIGGGAFNECYNLTSVVIGNGVTSIGEWAFRYCTNFTSVYYNGSAVDWNRISISSNSNDYLTNAARYYYSETEPTTSGNYWHWVDGEVVVWPAHVHTEEILPAVSATCTDGLTQGKKCSVCGEILVEQEVILAEHNYENRICTLCGGVQGSDGLAFSSNGDGTCSVVGIGTCTDTEIIIPKTSPDGDMVVSIGENAFFLCYNLTSVVIPNTVTKIGKLAFVLCENLTSVTIPASVSYIDEFAFSACINLISIEVDENNQHYCSIDGNLYSKDGKTLIKYASGKKDTSFEVSNNVIVIDAWAFDNCNSLVNVVISSSVTTIGYSTFAHCTSLTNITVDMNNQHYMSIDGNLYSKDGKELIQYAIGKTNTHFEIPSHVTSIWTEAFQNCDDLISVVIPNSVTSIGENAFSRCYSLTSVEFKDPNGWVIDGSYLLTSSELSNTSTAAQYLTSTCRYYIWSKQ